MRTKKSSIGGTNFEKYIIFISKGGANRG